MLGLRAEPGLRADLGLRAEPGLRAELGLRANLGLRAESWDSELSQDSELRAESRDSVGFPSAGFMNSASLDFLNGSFNVACVFKCIYMHLF